MAVVAAAAMVAAGLEVAAMLGLEVAATSDLEGAQAASGLEVVAAPVSSLDVAVAERSEVAVGSEGVGAAAAASLASGSMTSGQMIGGLGDLGGPVAHPGERAACARSHDLTTALRVVSAEWLAGNGSGRIRRLISRGSFRRTRVARRPAVSRAAAAAALTREALKPHSGTAPK